MICQVFFYPNQSEIGEGVGLPGAEFKTLKEAKLYLTVNGYRKTEPQQPHALDEFEELWEHPRGRCVVLNRS